MIAAAGDADGRGRRTRDELYGVIVVEGRMVPEGAEAEDYDSPHQNKQCFSPVLKWTEDRVHEVRGGPF